MAIKTVKTKKITWHYLTDFSDKELDFLKRNFKFHALDLRDCAGELQRTKIDIYKNYLFLVCQLPLLDKEKKRLLINQVYFFLGKDYLVMISREKIKILNDLFYKIIHGKKFKEEIFYQDSSYLLYKILDYLLRDISTIYRFFEEEINKVEEEIDESTSKKLVFEIASLRRLILQFKTIIDPQCLVTHTLSKLDVNFLNKEVLVYFDDLDDLSEKNWFLLKRYQDRVLSLYEINESLISYRTNQIIKVLTIFSVALLPLTLLAGIYGMNIDLPFANRAHVIWVLFGTLALIIIGIFTILKKKNWI